MRRWMMSNASRRRCYPAVISVLLLTGCSSTPLASASDPPARPAVAPISAAPATQTPALVCLLPGEASALPALPPGVPFTGHLLIAESSGQSRILEINPHGVVTWTLRTTSRRLARPIGPPDDAFYTVNCMDIVANSEYGQGALAVNQLTGATLWQIGTYLRRGDNLTHFNNPDDAVPAADGTI